MSYLENQRQKWPVSDQVTFFSHPVTTTDGGVFKNADREFVLTETALNIRARVRKDAISYFSRSGPKLLFLSNTKKIIFYCLSALAHLALPQQHKPIQMAVKRV
jgi:hypothetical protein